MENYLSWSNLYARAPEHTDQNCDPECVQYLSWVALKPELEEELEFLGKLRPDALESDERELHYDEAAYWSPESQIDPLVYPYAYSDVYRKRGCNSHYLVYTEWGGHRPEKRARLVRRHLITEP